MVSAWDGRTAGVGERLPTPVPALLGTRGATGAPPTAAGPAVAVRSIPDTAPTGIVGHVSRDALPPDPFAGDPHDPALSLDGPEPGDQEVLSETERDEVVADLADLAVYQALLEARGVRGIVVDCGDCGEQHFHEWSLLRASLQQLLDEGQMRPHEPAFDPDPASYVTWEYCRGYADAVLSDS
jgi:hypothetical protein